MALHCESTTETEQSQRETLDKAIIEAIHSPAQDTTREKAKLDTTREKQEMVGEEASESLRKNFINWLYKRKILLINWLTSIKELMLHPSFKFHKLA